MRPLRNLFLAGLLAVLSSVAQAQSTKAIDFVFTTVDGKTLRLSDFKGRWVLVNFWAPWCPQCWAEVPTLKKLHRRADFVVIGVGLDYGPDASVVRDTARKREFDVHIVAGGGRRDPDSPYRQVGPVDFFPTSYLYAPDGEIVMFVPGQLRETRLLDFMREWSKRNRGG